MKEIIQEKENIFIVILMYMKENLKMINQWEKEY